MDDVTSILFLCVKRKLSNDKKGKKERKEICFHANQLAVADIKAGSCPESWTSYFDVSENS
jgi:hypothetical protein